MSLWKRAPTVARNEPTSPWRAAAVIPGEHACDMARAMQNTRWLSGQVPRLPLRGCDALRCDCRYKHFADRRTEDRRRVDRTGLPRNFPGEEMRGPRRGRRQTD